VTPALVATLGAEYDENEDPDDPSDLEGALYDDIELALKLPPPMRPPLLAASAASGVIIVAVTATASANADAPTTRDARSHHDFASSSIEFFLFVVIIFTAVSPRRSFLASARASSASPTTARIATALPVVPRAPTTTTPRTR
jgi:hypothetical protein